MPDDKIRFHYLKSQFFRVIHADGAYGGMTPHGEIFVSVFSERPPIPTMMVNRLDDGGRLGDEIREERQSRDGIVREAEVGLTLSVEVAKSLIEWLQQKVEEAERLREVSRDLTKGKP